MSTQKILRSVLALAGVLMILGVQVGQAQHSGHAHNGRQHQVDWPDSLTVVEVSGTAEVDSTFFHPLYFLDEEPDGSVDYRLAFGPYWYEPESGATRPADGDAVSIRGGLFETSGLPTIAVFEINGLVWRDSTGAPPWSGGWVHRDATDTTYIHCPTDSLDRIGYPPQSMHGMMFPDSIYCQFEEMPVDSMPGLQDSTMFEGYYTENFRGHGGHMRGSNMRMGFGRDIGIRFHYDEEQVSRRGLSESSIQVQYLDSNLNWQLVDNAAVDVENNSVAIAQREVATFYALSADVVTSVRGNRELLPREMTMRPNYPNPFNPETILSYQLRRNVNVSLAIFDVAGRLVKRLISDRQGPGEYSVVWDSTNDNGQQVASGVYIAVLRADTASERQKMLLIK